MLSQRFTVNIVRIGIRGTDRAMFRPTNQCGPAIAAGVTCNYVVTFTPTSVGVRGPVFVWN